MYERLRVAGFVFMAGSGIHIFDHLRRGQTSVTNQLYWAGNLALILQVVIVTLILTRHPAAPAAALGGFPLGIGFFAAHWLPTWSSLSDSFTSHHVSLFSDFASAAEIVGAIAVGLCGLAIVRAKARTPVPA